MKQYKIINGTSYDLRSSDEVIGVLESVRQNRTRIHISLGDETGRDWLEEFDSHGYVGRSTGQVKVPLLVANRRSLGGGAILDHCVVRIRESAGGRVLFQHPHFHTGKLEIRPRTTPIELPDRILTVDVLRDGEIHASFETIEQAHRWFKRLGLTVNSAA